MDSSKTLLMLSMRTAFLQLQNPKASSLWKFSICKHAQEIFPHVVLPMASMSLALQRQPSMLATYSAADGGVAQNMVWPSSVGYDMQMQKGATGPAGGSPFFVKDEKQ